MNSSCWEGTSEVYTQSRRGGVGAHTAKHQDQGHTRRPKQGMHTISGVVMSEVATRNVQGTVVPTHQQEGQRNKGEAKRIHSEMQIHNSNYELHGDGKPLAPVSLCVLSTFTFPATF